jgi:hypothetical protein
MAGWLPLHRQGRWRTGRSHADAASPPLTLYTPLPHLCCVAAGRTPCMSGRVWAAMAQGGSQHPRLTGCTVPCGDCRHFGSRPSSAASASRGSPSQRPSTVPTQLPGVHQEGATAGGGVLMFVLPAHPPAVCMHNMLLCAFIRARLHVMLSHSCAAGGSSCPSPNAPPPLRSPVCSQPSEQG